MINYRQVMIDSGIELAPIDETVRFPRSLSHKIKEIPQGYIELEEGAVIPLHCEITCLYLTYRDTWNRLSNEYSGRQYHSSNWRPVVIEI